MGTITQVLARLAQGEAAAADELLPLIYRELRVLASSKLARENPGQTLQATALVHEAYIRLVDAQQPQHFNSKGHFYSAAAEAMRRILIEQARSKARLKRGGNVRHVDLELNEPHVPGPATDILAIDEALEKLALEHPAKAEVVRLRYFCGLTLTELAEVIGISRPTADRYWKFARAWLALELSRGVSPAD